jgi:ADP-heptose:LPS heptosyltransferase
MSDDIRRVCVLRSGAMGDILMTTPAVRAVAEHFGTRDIDFIVGRGYGDALTGIPYLRHVIEFGPRGEDVKPRNLLPFLAELRRQRYDLFINFQTHIKTSIIMLGSGAPRMLFFKKDRRPQRATGKPRHAIDDFLKELRPLGITDIRDRHMDFVVPAEVHERVAVLLAAEGIQPSDPVLIANPGGTRLVNRWPPEKYVAFLDRMAEELPDVRLIVSGGPDDVERAMGISEAVRPTTQVLNLAGQLKIKETGALLARANVLVTPDTGPMHIGSALGTPMVVLSGAADPNRTGPLSPRDLVVINRDLPCVPCGDRTCRRGDIACMTQMSVDWVMEAVRRRLGRFRRPIVVTDRRNAVPDLLYGTRHIEEVSAAGIAPVGDAFVGEASIK